jgi:hypothetical protein
MLVCRPLLWKNFGRKRSGRCRIEMLAGRCIQGNIPMPLEPQQACAVSYVEAAHTLFFCFVLSVSPTSSLPPLPEESDAVDPLSSHGMSIHSRHTLTVLKRSFAQFSKQPQAMILCGSEHSLMMSISVGAYALHCHVLLICYTISV